MLVIGSGNVVHNLGGMSRDLADAGFDWAQRFDEDAKERDAHRPDRGGALDGHRDFGHAVPTPGPLPAAALPRRAGRRRRSTGTDVLVDGYAYGSLSMTAYTLDHSGPGSPVSGG